MPQIACITLRAWPGYDLRIETRIRLWKMPSAGMHDIAHFGQLQAHQRQENALDGLAHVEILHGRRADDGGGVDRVLALRDAGDVEHRVFVGQRIEAGVIAERAFACAARPARRSLRARSRRWPELPDRTSRTSPSPPGLPRRKPAIIISSRSGGSGRIAEYMVAGSAPIATATSMRLVCPLRLQPAVMLGALLVRLPVHAGGALVEDLHAVHAAVALAGVGIARKHHAAA